MEKSKIKNILEWINCIIIAIMGGYKISFILYGGISILLDLGIISKKYKGNE